MNKYLHTVASVGFLFTLNYDARSHEIKKNGRFLLTSTLNTEVINFPHFSFLKEEQPLQDFRIITEPPLLELKLFIKPQM